MVTLQIRNGRFQFVGAQEPFFNHVQLSFEECALHYIQGDNGSGKSTLMRILVGDHAGTFSGSIAAAGRMHLIAQQTDTMIVPHRTVLQNLSLATLNRFPGFNRFPRVVVPPFLRRVCLQAHAGTLSGGQKQLLALAMALGRRATILLLDEPTAALDAFNAGMVFEVLHEMAQTMALTIIVVCHDQDRVQPCGASTVVRVVAQPGMATRLVTQKVLR